MFDDGKRKPVATQDFVDPRSGRRVRVSYNDVEATRELRERGFKREGGIREERCHSYQVNTGGNDNG